MHQKYRSGEPRTNQSASGSGTGSENSGNQTGSDTENSGKPDSGEDTASPESTANLVDETKTKLTDANDKTEDGACKLRTGRHHEGR